MTKIFQNENVSVTFNTNDKKPYLVWHDQTDRYNGFQGFTRNVRGIKKAVAFIEHLSTVEELKHDLTMGDCTDIMEKFNLKPHTFCAVD